MDKNQDMIDRAAAILEQVAEPSFQHTNQSGALFIEARKIIFKLAGVSGFAEEGKENYQENID
jgi:hypothetical protein